MCFQISTTVAAWLRLRGLLQTAPLTIDDVTHKRALRAVQLWERSESGVMQESSYRDALRQLHREVPQLAVPLLQRRSAAEREACNE
jgi:hypothetical protein